MANGWTPERRARQAALIQLWQPWNKSTGPTSAEGKAKASRNADKGGERALQQELSALLQELEQWRNSLL